MTSHARTDDAGSTLQIRIACGLAVLCGLWLIVSPWVFGTGVRHGAAIDDPIVGIVVALLAVDRFFGAPTNVWPSWATVPFGIWTLISPWIYGVTAESPGLQYDSVALGIIIVALSVWAALTGLKVEDRMHASFG